MTAPRLVGTFGARDAEELLALLRDPVALVADVIELRLDVADGAAARVEELVAASPRPVIATFRRREGTAESERLRVLRRAATAGASWIDVEDDVADEAVRTLATAGASVLRSLHARLVPSDADDVVAHLLRPPAAAAKLVAHEGGAADVLRVLDLVRRNEGRLAAHVVGVPFSRAASAALGAPFVYAALRPGGRLGLPMPTVRWMRSRARFARLRPGRPLFVLLGGDVEGSVSPDMLNAAFESAGPDAVALRWSCDDPGPALDALRRFGWLGAAVTMPHKERVRDLLVAEGRLGPTAVEVGAVNTVVNEGGTLVGHNTDLDGLLDALAPHLPPEGIAGRPFLVLGAGGAARAAVAAARRLGAEPMVVARRPERAAALGATVTDAESALARGPAVVVSAIPWIDPRADETVDDRQRRQLDPRRASRPAVALDMYVSDAPTDTVRDWAEAGHRTVAGLEMLVHQAAHQVPLLGGSPPDLARMTAVGRVALARRDRQVVLVGLRCAGKSTVGALLADLLGRSFTDLDALIDESLQRASGERIEDLLRSGKERVFRAAEAAHLRLWATLPREQVLAPGGGAALHREEFAALAAVSAVVLLDAPDEVLLARRANSPRVPLTSRPPAEELALQRAERLPVYRAAASLTVDVSSLDPVRVAERIAAWWDELAASELPPDAPGVP